MTGPIHAFGSASPFHLMPIVKPRKDQDHDSYISSCMSSKVMQEYKDTKQRYAICESTWDRSKKRAKGEDESTASWDETEAEISKAGFIETEEEIRLIIPENLAAIPSAPQDGKTAI